MIETDVPAVAGCATCAARAEAGYPGACAQHQADAAVAEKAEARAATRDRSYSESGAYIGNATERQLRADNALRERDLLEPAEALAVYQLWNRSGRGRISQVDPELNRLANTLRRPAVTVKLWTEQLLGLETDGKMGYKDIEKFSPYILDVWGDGFAVRESA